MAEHITKVTLSLSLSLASCPAQDPPDAVVIGHPFLHLSRRSPLDLFLLSGKRPQTVCEVYKQKV